jgi:hypothetical protein
MPRSLFQQSIDRTFRSAEASEAFATTDYKIDCFVTSEVCHNDMLTYARPVRQMDARSGAHLGVGPCQNFTYIGALNPTLALIVDARTDNSIGHLIFKLLFERADHPLSFLRLLFSRDAGKAGGGLLESFDDGEVSEESYARNREWILQQLRDRFGLADVFLAAARRIYEDFYRRQLDISSVSEQTLANLDKIPTLREVIASRSSAGLSTHHLTDPERYRRVREAQLRDEVIPVLGNVTGPATVDFVNSLLRAAQTSLASIYISNMEEFLLQRYVIENDRITSRPNPSGALEGVWSQRYQLLTDALGALDSDEHAILYRVFFPGDDGEREVGAWPWLTGHVTALHPFLRRLAAEKPRSIIETYL